jgi:thiol-disulfide isomerase/thioredoxin
VNPKIEHKLKYFNQFFLFIILFFFGCKKEPVISYEDAMNNGPREKHFNVLGTDTMFYETLPLENVLNAQLPLFETKMMDGRTLNPDYFEGKISIINFWFIGCKPCEEEMPGFNALVEKYKDKPVQFLAFSRNKPEDIKEFMLEHPFNVDHVALAELIIKDFFKYAWGYPVTMVADQYGKIIHIQTASQRKVPLDLGLQEDLIPVIDGALKRM